MFDVDGDGKPEDVFYNGFRAGSDIAGPVLYRDGQELPNEAPQGARRLGVENMAKSCIQGRGVMIDLEAHFGRSGEIVGYEQLMRVLEQDRVVVEPGDLVCLRTGFAEMLLAMNKQPDAELLRTTNCALDGRDERLLFRLGVYLGEMWHLTELADWLRANGRNRFLLTAPPLRLPGAVGSPATPVATV